MSAPDSQTERENSPKNPSRAPAPGAAQRQPTVDRSINENRENREIREIREIRHEIPHPHETLDETLEDRMKARTTSVTPEQRSVTAAARSAAAPRGRSTTRRLRPELALWLAVAALSALAFLLAPAVALAEPEVGSEAKPKPKKKPAEGEAGAKPKKKPVAVTAEAKPKPAEGESPASPADGAEAAAEGTEAAPPPVARPWCDERAPMSIVVAYDAGKHFYYAEAMALEATKAFAETLCVDDSVRVAVFGTKVEWQGPAIVIAGDEQRAEVVKLFKKRPKPESGNSINDTLVKAAFEHWEEEQLAEGEIPALYVFTDTIESDAPSRSLFQDFAWNDLPSFLRKEAMIVVSLLDHKRASGTPVVYTMNAPPGHAIEKFPSAGTTTFADVQAAFVPEPVPVAVAAVQGVQGGGPRPGASEGRAASWLEDPWNLAMLGGGVLALMVLGFVAGRGVRRRGEPTAEEVAAQAAAAARKAPAREVTFLLWDRMSRQVVREETRTLDEALSIGATSRADFVVPGPYSMELVNDQAGPALRSSNMLGLEVLRSSGRRLTLSEHEMVPLRSGDRLDIGGGHEVEVRIR